MPYEEIGDISHCVPQVSFFQVADYVAYQDSLGIFETAFWAILLKTRTSEFE